MFCQFSKAERIDYARRLERIESLKAKGRMSDGGKGKETFPDLKGQTRDTVASKLGIGSGKQYEKEKYIVENKNSLSPEDFADWDEGKLSTNPIKLGRCIKELERIYGFREGRPEKLSNNFTVNSDQPKTNLNLRNNLELHVNPSKIIKN